MKFLNNKYLIYAIYFFRKKTSLIIDNKMHERLNVVLIRVERAKLVRKNLKLAERATLQVLKNSRGSEEVISFFTQPLIETKRVV